MNISVSTFSGSKLHLCWLITNPAVEKTLSAGTEVAGMQRYLRASLAILRKRS